MTLKVKKDGAWKEASSLKVKINGEWKDVSTLYSKKDGAWVTVYSSGALITFTNYPYPIPVAAGWKYSTDKVNWTTVSSDGTINESGTFTGWVKATSITLNEYCTEYVPASSGRMDGEGLSVARSSSTSFVNGGKGYVCGGESETVNEYDEYVAMVVSTVDVYDSSGTRTTGAGLSVARQKMTSFVNCGKAYVCGGGSYNTDTYKTVDVYDESGNRTTGNSIGYPYKLLTSFVIGDKGFVCGGLFGSALNTGNYSNSVYVYDSSGNMTGGASLKYNSGALSSFVIGNKGFVCGGYKYAGSSKYNYWTTVNIYDESGTRTLGTDMGVGRCLMSSFVNGGKGYLCGGENANTYYSDYVDVYDESGNRTVGTPLTYNRKNHTSFTLGSYGYVCGGHNQRSGATYWKYIEKYDSSGVKTISDDTIFGIDDQTSFVNGNRAYVCGGGGRGFQSTVHVFYDQPEILYTKLPITEGSTYTLNGESGTADVSKVMEFDSKVSGTIKYKEGDMSPGVRIAVVDENGNVISGASITVEGA